MEKEKREIKNKKLRAGRFSELREREKRREERCGKNLGNWEEKIGGKENWGGGRPKGVFLGEEREEWEGKKEKK